MSPYHVQVSNYVPLLTKVVQLGRLIKTEINVASHHSTISISYKYDENNVFTSDFDLLRFLQISASIWIFT